MLDHNDAVKPNPAVLRGGRPLRILHCPWNVAGQSAQLAIAERALGADSRCVVIEETAKGFPADEVLATPNPGIIQREIARWRLLWRAMHWADVVHFSFGQSCLVPHAFPYLSQINWCNPVSIAWRLYCRMVWLKDLPLLAAMGKTLAVTWQGDDARQYDRSLELFEISIARSLGEGYYLPGSDLWKRRTIAEFARHVPLHYALNPDLMHVLPTTARFLPYASFDVASVTPTFPDLTSERRLIFAHAPSHRGAKGTNFVLAAAEALRAEGLVFELRLIENMQRDNAIAAYADCDIMIDQLLVGWYGGLGLEAMALGLPVISYLRDEDLGALPAAMRRSLPVINATPSTIADVMRSIITMPRMQLAMLAHKSREFVMRWHSPAAIASCTLSDYNRCARQEIA